MVRLLLSILSETNGPINDFAPYAERVFRWQQRGRGRGGVDIEAVGGVQWCAMSLKRLRQKAMNAMGDVDLSSLGESLRRVLNSD